MNTNEVANVHVFEAAGLGKAPFKITFVETRKGPMPVLGKDGQPTGMTIGAPGQPMGTCAFCGTGIAECWGIKSADGKHNIVGCECIRKVGDRGMIKEINRHATAKRHKKEAERIAGVVALLADPAARAKFSALPSPNKYRTNDTLLTWAEWMMRHAGNTGKMTVVKVLGKVE